MTAASPSTNGPTTGTGYRPVLRTKESDDSLSSKAQLADLEGPALYVRPDTHFRNATYILTFATIVLLSTTIYGWLPYAYIGGGLGRAGHGCDCSGPKPPQYFQTSPELWAGPTATGRAAFMAQTRVFEPTATFVPNEPLQTSIPIEGMQQGNESIFQMMGFLSPYSPSPGFGVDEYPIPEGADIVQVQMLSRHGARYPTSGSNVAALGQKLGPLGDNFKPQGDLAFLKDWKYQLGAEILVPKGRQELYDSGVLHSYMYGRLYNPNSKLIVRTTTQDRMLKSAENWVSGFFGLEWTKNATIEVIIEDGGFNNSLAGSLNCPNAYAKSTGGEAQKTWVEIYLKDAVARFNSMTSGFEWTTDDVYAAQNMCPYETVAYGYSRFCELFTYQEWQDFGYSIDLAFSGSSAFHSPTGRAVGLGYQQEVMARLRNHTLGYSGSQINTTLDGMPETFPLNQSLYFDFSHDTNIASVLTAFGLVQFKEDLPADKNPLDHAYKISHITPFGARLDIEVIRTPKPVSPNRDGYLRGGETKYVHFVLNQRTLPLGKSFPECDPGRRDGWCEFDTFVKVQEGMRGKAQYEHACFGKYEATPYGEVTDGAPVQP
ncbi:3-phytase A [Emericellopsis cladophorae]|uniref:3-phytase n=1 Tax=Emericellopsis cladophorae TaxID=2686198 RepID=A0A9P9Y5C8_9HYPO|nr:3-phytase A [Emericellopsis cladophorae]KAI6783807.1 3-phytase A [Emericellopsis cladophorae]